MAKQETPKKNITVSVRKDGKFAVKPEGARCATKVLESKDEALAFAQELAERNGVTVIPED